MLTTNSILFKFSILLQWKCHDFVNFGLLFWELLWLVFVTVCFLMLVLLLFELGSFLKLENILNVKAFSFFENYVSTCTTPALIHCFGYYLVTKAFVTQCSFAPYSLSWGESIVAAGNSGIVQFYDSSGGLCYRYQRCQHNRLEFFSRGMEQIVFRLRNALKSNCRSTGVRSIFSKAEQILAGLDFHFLLLGHMVRN